jgi:hypothetical protein
MKMAKRHSIRLKPALFERLVGAHAPWVNQRT